VRPVITLTTDFGRRDAWVGAMKGVIVGIAGDVTIVDISHDIAAHDVEEAAFALETAARWFPPGTIHVAVVDPGVGTVRRGLVVEAGGHRFVGPDNGLFTPFLVNEARAFALDTPAYRLPAVSATFHGRDVFAPAAAHLALGVDPARFGPRVAAPIRLAWDVATVDGTRIRGRVVHVDRFGNLVTSIRADLVAAAGEGLRVKLGRQLLPLVRTYGDLRRRHAGALIGSGERLEIAVREGNAARRFSARRGTPVVVETLPVRTRRSSQPPRKS
jgi:S-adenosylmethionine hydrolase